MSTTTIRKSIALAALALAIPSVAGAAPIDDDEPNLPLNQAPVARVSVTPNPALVSPQQTLAQARAFGVAGTLFDQGDVVKFDGSASTDDTGIVKYEYDLDGNGSYEVSGANPKTSRRYNAVGTYKIKLRVTDEGGKLKVVTKDLIVHAPPKPALAASPTVALVGQQVAYSAAGSTDDNGIAKYEWDLDGDGTYETATGTTQAASSSYTAIGERNVRLRVTDVYGATSAKSVKVTVHRAPTAAFTAAPNPAFTDQLVTFDGSASGDDDPIARYEWDLDGDGTFETDTANTATATKSFAAPGTVTIRLRVTDSHGVQDVVAQALTVNPKPVDATAPVVKITPGSAKLGKGGKVMLKVSCPVGESQCTGRLALRSLRGARSAALGGKAFSVLGGETVKVSLKLSKANRKAVKKLRRLRAQATATATDAAGNTGTARKRVTIRR